MSMNQTKERPSYNLWQNSLYMIRLSWKYKKITLLSTAIVAALTVATGLLNLFITPAILDAVYRAVPLSSLLLIILVFVGGLLFVSAFKAYIDANLFYHRMPLRKRLADFITLKMLTTSYPNVESDSFRKKFDAASKPISGNSEATEAIWGTFVDILSNIAGFIIFLVILSVLELWVMAVILLTTIVSFLVSNYLNGWAYRNRDEDAKYQREVKYIAHTGSQPEFAKDIRIFNMVPWLKDIYKGTIELYRSFLWRAKKVYIWGNVVELILSIARNGIAYIALVYIALSQDLSVSLFMLYFGAIGGFSEWTRGIFTGFATLHKQSLDLCAVREFIEYPESFTFEEGLSLVPERSKNYQLELSNVSFSYPDSDKKIISNINLKISPGEKLAIVGLNGAGKTTLVKLLCGLLDPTDGAVLLNGEDIRKYNRRDYYQHFSAVFQDFSILAVSLADNITQEVDLDNAKLEYVTSLAGLTDKFDSLPKKFETSLTKKIYDDGIELSGGQTQRLMLARALYKEAPIIILDEPTAALDPIAEADLYTKYNELSGGNTSLFISHRLASTGFCDRIILLEDGHIIEEGTHEQLIDKDGKYAHLFEVQSHYYKDGSLI